MPKLSVRNGQRNTLQKSSFVWSSDIGKGLYARGIKDCCPPVRVLLLLRTPTTMSSDPELAQGLATEAGQLLLDVRRELAEAADADRRNEGNRRSQAFLARRLGEDRPQDAVLSEEAFDDGTRLRAEGVWIIDPLDGTREFSELDRRDWAVHVGTPGPRERWSPGRWRCRRSA